VRVLRPQSAETRIHAVFFALQEPQATLMYVLSLVIAAVIHQQPPPPGAMVAIAVDLALEISLRHAHGPFQSQHVFTLRMMCHVGASGAHCKQQAITA
jgi:hypothetical protein